MGLAFGLGLALAGCKDTTESTPAGPSFAVGGNTVCSFNTVKQNIRSYAPGNGNGSSKAKALDIAANLESYCNSSNSGAYTTETYKLLKNIFEVGLEGDLPDGALGSPSTGNAIIQAIITMPSWSGAAAFDPCGLAGALPNPSDPEACYPWEGWPTAPDLTAALTGPDNMFAVIGPASLGAVELTSVNAICSGPAAPCETVMTGLGPETWGFRPEPPATWSDVQGGKPSLFFGHPLSNPMGPTGESPLSLGSGFYASSMPFYADFPGPNQLAITFCTVEDPAAGLVSTIAHEEAATETATLGDWCVPGTHASLSSGFFGTFASVARSVLTARPLYAALAAVHATSPTGGIGGFGSHFYAFETNPTGVLDVLNGPLRDATTGGPIVGANGQPLRVRARTSTSTFSNPTGIENVVLEFVLSNNNGTIPSGNALISLDPSNPDLVCSNSTVVPAWTTLPSGDICRARTGPDQTAGAGIAVFAGITSTKNGGFKVTIREWSQSGSQFDFNPVSAGQFNNKPN